MPVSPPAVTESAVRAALDAVKDPEIRRPITDLRMVDRVDIAADGTVSITVLLTIAALSDAGHHRARRHRRRAGVPGVRDVRLTLTPMTDAQRTALREQLRGGATKDIPFARPDPRTAVYAIASGKGGVGKSTVTVNLAASLAAQGLSVGVLDADVYGFSVPRMLGVHTRPTRIGDMILPPIAHGVKVISVGMFVDGNVPVVWRGPMLHRALQQFLADVFWGDLDVLLLDLPPGTGDMAISTRTAHSDHRDPGGDHPADRRLRGRRARRRHRRPDPADGRRRGGEHVGDDNCPTAPCWTSSVPEAGSRSRPR